jgi:hypothetical protein
MCAGIAGTPIPGFRTAATNSADIRRQAEREARCGHIARCSRGEIDVEVVVEPRRARQSIKVQARRHHIAALRTNCGNPMRRGAEELSTREGVIDGLVEEIERGERAKDDVVVPWPEVVEPSLR